MSGHASTAKGGESFTAFEYRRRYQEEGKVYPYFYCPNPSCQIRLAPRLIYIAAKRGSKTPHFYTKWGPHIGNCNGEPEEQNKPELKPAVSHYVSSPIDYPQRLITRPQPRIYSPTPGGDNPGGDIPRPAGGKGPRVTRPLGAAVPRHYLIRAFVEHYRSVLKAAYAKQKDNSWSNEERGAWLKEELSSKGVDLSDRTNYEDAFRTPRFINWRQQRIYHSSGTVQHSDDKYIITSTTQAKYKGKDLPFKVVVSTGLAALGAPRDHVARLSELEQYLRDEKEVRWYAYGSPELCNNEIILVLKSLDHIHMVLPFLKK